jgi:hypothetical protein
VESDIMPNLYWKKSEKSKIDLMMSTKSSYQTSCGSKICSLK